MFKVLGIFEEYEFSTMEEAVEAIERGRINDYPEDVVILTPAGEMITGGWEI